MIGWRLTNCVSKKCSNSNRQMVPSWAIATMKPSRETAGSMLVQLAAMAHGKCTVWRPRGAHALSQQWVFMEKPASSERKQVNNQIRVLNKSQKWTFLERQGGQRVWNQFDRCNWHSGTEIGMGGWSKPSWTSGEGNILFHCELLILVFCARWLCWDALGFFPDIRWAPVPKHQE